MNLLSHFSAIGLVGWLADFYLPATLLMLVAIVARRWVRQPAQRLTVHWIVAVELAVLAAVCAMPFWPRISLRGATAQKSAVETPRAAEDPLSVPAPLPRTAFPRLPRAVPEFDAPATPGVEQPIVPLVAPPARWSWLEMAAAAYLATAGLVVAWLIWGAVAAARVCRHSENAPESWREELARIVGDDRRAPRLLVSSRVKTAVALGLRRPTILLPAGLVEGGSPQAIRAILTHEWAHIRNGDLWLLALGRCLLVLLFPHPLLWWLRREIRGDQELLADAAAAGDNRPAYAEELLRLVRKTAYPSPLAASVAVGIWESSSQLSRRIAMLLDESFRVEPRASRRWRYRALGLLVLLGAACSLLTLQPARSAGQAAQADSPRPGHHVLMVAGEGQGVRASDSPFLVAGDAHVVGEQGPGALTLTAATDGSGKVTVRGSLLALPGKSLRLLGQPAVLSELELTAEQKQKLHAINDKYYSDQAKFIIEATQVKKLPPDKLAAAQAQWFQNHSGKEIQKQVEEVLTTAQVQLLKELTLREDAYFRLSDPNRVKKLALAKEQKDALHLLHQEGDDWLHRNHQATIDKTLSVLTPQQRSRLREEALGPLGPGDDLGQYFVHVKGEANPICVYSLEPYPDFTQPRVRKQLNLTAAQEQQVRDILGGSANLAERLAREVEKLSPEARKKLPRSGFDSKGAAIPTGGNQCLYGGSPDGLAKIKEKMIEERKKLRAGFAEQPTMRPSIELRKQFEAILTPQQLALYQDLAVRNFAANAATDQVMLKMVGASEQQEAEVARFFRDSVAKELQFYREMGQKLLKVLTPAQQGAFRAEVEKQLVNAEPPSGGAKPAAEDGDSRNTVSFGSGTFVLSPPAAQPAPGINAYTGVAAKTGSGTATGTPNLSVPQRFPPYNGIFFPELQKELKLSAEQCKRLSEVSADFWTKFKELSKENSDMTDQRKRAKYWANINQLARDCRKQIEAVVTPQQLEAYKKEVFPRHAFELLSLAQPEGRKTIGITSGQEEKLQQIFKKRSQRPTEEEMERMEQAKDAVLTALSPPQREKLRSDVERNIRNDEESSLSYSIGTYSDMPIFNLAGESGSRWAPMVLPFYSELTEMAIAKRLGLSADQRKQLTQVAGEHRGETEKLAREIKKLSPDQRKRPEFQQKARRMLEAVRRRTEAVLTPQQLAALQETVFRRRAFSTLADPKVEVKIGLDDQQKAAVKRINEEPAIRQDRILREAERKLFGVLTPQQQEKIREVIDRQGW